tara:strand:- start:304 stop:486 length:183 start_codon:yes stop_codon:yes gene_type:complete
MNNEKSETRIPPIPDGVRNIQVTYFNNRTNQSHLIESLNLFRKIKGSPFNSWKEGDNGEV